jgi:hypothetical protein
VSAASRSAPSVRLTGVLLRFVQQHTSARGLDEARRAARRAPRTLSKAATMASVDMLPPGLHTTSSAPPSANTSCTTRRARPPCSTPSCTAWLSAARLNCPVDAPAPARPWHGASASSTTTRTDGAGNAASSRPAAASPPAASSASPPPEARSPSTKACRPAIPPASPTSAHPHHATWSSTPTATAAPAAAAAAVAAAAAAASGALPKSLYDTKAQRTGIPLRAASCRSTSRTCRPRRA